METEIPELVQLAARDDGGTGVGTRKYNRSLIDLGVARAGPDELGISGCSLYVEQLNGSLDLAFDNPEGVLLALREGEVYYVDFERVFLSNIAQTFPDIAQLLVGTERGSFEKVGAFGKRPILVYPKSVTSGAMALSTLEARRFKLVKVTMSFNTKPSTVEDATLKLNAKDGAVYDTVLARSTPSSGSGTGDVVWTGEPNDIYESGDELDVAFPNTDNRTVSVRIETEPA